MDRVEAFYTLAKSYCRYLAENEINYDSIPFLMELLINIYVSALNLPELEPESTLSQISDIDKQTINISKQIPTLYWTMFDPYKDDKPVCGDITDDLSDIAYDLQYGIKEYDNGKIGNAVFEWRFGLNAHWGNHAIDALKALHTLRTK